MNAPDVHTLTGPYVLAALPDDERQAFEQHLAYCSACAAEVVELQEAAIRLSTQVTVAPPPALKLRVLASVDRVRQVPPTVADDDVPRSPRRGFGRRSILTLAAAAVVIAASGGVTIDQYRARATATQAGDVISAVLAEPDARTVHGEVTGGGRASVVMSSHRDTAVVVLRELSPLTSRQTYQLWKIDSTHAARSVGLVGGNLTQVVRGVSGTVAFGISVEPEGGSTRPTVPAAAMITLT